jgi:hypothetical protein
LDPLPGKSQYLRGKDPSRWTTGVPQYARVKFTGLYPHIDLVYYGSPGKLEYDFVVNPGGDPKEIRLAFQGAQSVSAGPRGSLRVAIGGERLDLALPRTYQRGPGGERRPVPGRFVLRGSVAGFEVGAYDPSRPLIIDPTMTVDYSTYVGGGLAASNNEFTGMAVDPSGYVYLVEDEVTSTGYPTTPGAYQTASKGQHNVVIFKMNQAGTAPVFATYLGGSGHDWGIAIAADGAGNCYVAGQTDSPDFPTTPGAFQTALAGSPPAANESNAFVTKLNPSGSALVYSTYLGGSHFPSSWTSDTAVAIAVDGAGNAYVTGSAESTDFPTTPGAYQAVNHGGVGFNGYDAFVTKLNPAGTALVYSTFLGGSSGDATTSIALDGAGEATVAGYTASTDFPVSSGCYQPLILVTGGIAQGFVTRLNSAGTGLAYSTYLGGASDGAQIFALAVDADGSAYVTGKTGSHDYPTTPGSYQSAYLSGSTYEAFVTKLNPAGTGLAYSTFIAGAAGAEGLGIAIYADGYALVSAQTYGANFPTTAGSLQPTGPPESAAWLILDPAGATALYATYWAGMTNTVDDGPQIGLDAAGSIYFVGGTYSNNYPTTSGAYQTALSSADEDLFIAKFSATGIVTPTPTAVPPPAAPCVIHLWPDPFNPDTAVWKLLKMDCIPDNAEVDFYTVSGELVQKVYGTGGGATWDGKNQAQAPVAPGVYFYAVQNNHQVLGTGKFLVTRGF